MRQIASSHPQKCGAATVEECLSGLRLEDKITPVSAVSLIFLLFSRAERRKIGLDGVANKLTDDARRSPFAMPAAALFIQPLRIQLRLLPQMKSVP